jgi:hypothetical protein
MSKSGLMALSMVGTGNIVAFMLEIHPLYLILVLLVDPSSLSVLFLASHPLAQLLPSLRLFDFFTAIMLERERQTKA